VLFLVDQYNDNSVAARVKKEIPSVKLILGWDGILWHKASTYEYSDVVLTCVASTAEFYKNSGKNVYYHKFGFEEDVLARLNRTDKRHNISFTGSLIPHPDYHLSRLHAVAEMQRNVDLNIWAGSLPKDWSLWNPGRLWYTLRHRQWRLGRDLHTVGKHNHGEVFGLDMFNVLYNSKIVFNTHGDNSPKQAANMRMTEVTGTGALLLTDWKENISEFFKPDEEIVTYKSLEEAIDKAKNLLRDENLRASIAKKGQERTLTQYSYKKRMQDFSEFILKTI
jgi:spore maturation protein CgeB